MFYVEIDEKKNICFLCGLENARKSSTRAPRSSNGAPTSFEDVFKLAAKIRRSDEKVDKECFAPPVDGAPSTDPCHDPLAFFGYLLAQKTGFKLSP